MMKKPENIRIPRHIGAERIYVTIPFDRQEFARDVEKEIDSLYTRWRHEFPANSDQEILAMVLYQFASFYRKHRAAYAEASEKAEELSAMLRDWDDNPGANAPAGDIAADFSDFRLESGDF